MRASEKEKMEIIELVEGSDLSVKQTLDRIGISRSTFYRWYDSYLKEGPEGLKNNYKRNQRVWNQIPEDQRDQIVELALKYPELSSREIAAKTIERLKFFISESSVYRILKANDLVASPCFEVIGAYDHFPQPTKRVHELWQTDFTYFKVIGWGWYYLSTVMDDYSRFIISWELCKGMKADDSIRTIEQAIKVSGVTHPKLNYRPRLLSDNGSCYVGKEMKSYLDAQEIAHTRGKPYHPMTQGKIERYHRSMKSIIKLEPFFFPEDLEQKIKKWVDYYNNQRYHISLNNLTPADYYFGRQDEKLRARKRLKTKCINQRRAVYFSKKLVASE